LQFRLAYVSPESRVVGAGDLVDHPIKIALHYFTGFFLIDLFAVLPIPQVRSSSSTTWFQVTENWGFIHIE